MSFNPEEKRNVLFHLRLSTWCQILMAILLLLILVSCHEPNAPMKPCGHITGIYSDKYTVSFYYQEERIPNFLNVSFRTDRPDTVRMNQVLCVK